MPRLILSVWLIMGLLLWGGSRGEAFVPETPHLLHLVIQKIKSPAGLKVSQVRQIPAGPKEMDKDLGALLPITEQLIYLFPGQLRAESAFENARQFYVVSSEAFVKVTEGQVTAKALTASEIYTDVLLHRDDQALAGVLAARGINVARAGFQRLEGRICYLIGDPTVKDQKRPGLWIEKESLFPVRYQVEIDQRWVDVRYEDWQKVGKTWYPRQTEVRVDDRLFSRITVEKMALETDFPASLFDVARILSTHPAMDKGSAQNDQLGHDDRVKALSRELDGFNRLYD